MAKYSHDTIVPFKDSELGKKQQIAQMFDRIAFRYDFLNRFLSGGIDIYWRKRAIRELASLRPGQAGDPIQVRPTAAAQATPHVPGSDLSVLDVATGTADMAIMMTRYLSPVTITGIDISTGMLEIGRQKIARMKLGDRITLKEGDSEAIPFPDDHFDAITVAFGVRNFENLEKGLKEMRRVLRPGGRLVILEFSHPKRSGFRYIYNLYMRLIAPGIAGIMANNREAYQYLNCSVEAFPEGEDLIRIIDGSGYANTRLRRLSLGICTIYVGEKL
jgi:demethylmenaquinone methyltransferase / 2-methoxy-6-polyprenyl-1,4-benzoquinol methylase